MPPLRGLRRLWVGSFLQRFRSYGAGRTRESLHSEQTIVRAASPGAVDEVSAKTYSSLDRGEGVPSLSSFPCSCGQQIRLVLPTGKLYSCFPSWSQCWNPSRERAPLEALARHTMSKNSRRPRPLPVSRTIPPRGFPSVTPTSCAKVR